MRAALELIAEKGPAGFTFADAARWAGVSPAAPYRHFRDRDELLVRRRAARLRAVRRRRCRAPGTTAGRIVLTAFDRLGKAYLAFRRAASRPTTRPCSRPAFRSIPIRELREAGERAFAVLRGAAEKLVALMPAAERPPALMVALHIWALSHGIASLFGRGDAARRTLPMRPRSCWRPAC